MYTLHIANKNYSSWSLRPWVLMKQLEISFEEKLHRFVPDRDGRSFTSFSPTGKVPLLVDGDVAVWDSLAIVEYLAERHPAVWPADTKARAWARSAAAEMHSGFNQLRSVCGMNVGVRVNLHEVPEGLRKDLVRLEELWADGMARFGGPFLAGGEFTAVDAFFCPVAYRIQTYRLPVSPTARAYAERLLALPAMAEWTAAALAEDFRDHPHEAELGSVGRVTEDLRTPETV
ncbi:MAG TPA: glutathione S-transferase family protein [Devosia sp.]|jgi:glutathione S-transferase|nr:glutathione S-transferase family protein [Devosia sp.]